jgi:predicted GTPase
MKLIFCLFVVDALVGVVTLDMEFANIVRRSKKPVFLVANKADNFERSDLVYEFYELALGEVFSVSALNGAGTGDSDGQHRECTATATNPSPLWLTFPNSHS